MIERINTKKITLMTPQVNPAYGVFGFCRKKETIKDTNTTTVAEASVVMCLFSSKISLILHLGSLIFSAQSLALVNILR